MMNDTDFFRRKYGRWAVVTGASSGIGRALAIQLAEKKLNLVLVARSEESLKQLSAALAKDHGVQTQIAAVDLTLSTAVEYIEKATSTLEVGLLVCSAGFGSSGSFLESDIEREENMLNLNCLSVMKLCHHFGNRLGLQKHGGIILLSSLVGFQGVPHSAHYSATKAYVQALAEALHLELKGVGVDVLSVAPGPVHSGFAERANMQYGMAQQADVVARATIAKLGKRMTIRPGPIAKLLGYSLSMLPRGIRVRLMSQIMSQMAIESKGTGVS